MESFIESPKIGKISYFVLKLEIKQEFLSVREKEIILHIDIYIYNIYIFYNLIIGWCCFAIEKGGKDLIEWGL